MYTVDAERWPWICSWGKGDICYEIVLTIVLIMWMHVYEYCVDQDPKTQKKKKVFYTIVTSSAYNIIWIIHWTEMVIEYLA